MTTNNVDFRIKNGLVVQGTQGTISGNPILTTASSINHLQDVDLTGIQNTNTLAWDNGVFKPAIAGSSGSGIQGIQGIQGIYGTSGLIQSTTAPTNTSILWLDTSIDGTSTYLFRHDFVSSSNTAYEGKSLAGYTESDNSWTIGKIVVASSGTTTVTHAYNAAWINRYTETYV